MTGDHRGATRRPEDTGGGRGPGGGHPPARRERPPTRPPAYPAIVSGGRPTHGELAGVIVLESPAPRIAGDLGHAGTFGFPVRYGVPRGFAFADLVTGDPSNLGLVIDTIHELEAAGVRFVVADCGFFSVFHREISRRRLGTLPLQQPDAAAAARAHAPGGRAGAEC